MWGYSLNWATLLKVLRAGGPKVVTAAAALWPLMRDEKARAELLQALKNTTNRSPSKRLAAKVQATVLIAEGISQDATSEIERERAVGWIRRGKNLARTLEMPVPGVRASRANRKAVSGQLGRLQQEMAAHLSET